MNITEFKSELITNINNFFPKADITIVEKRGIRLEVRVNISEYVFVEIYYNALTGKKSYALINTEQMQQNKHTLVLSLTIN